MRWQLLSLYQIIRSDRRNTATNAGLLTAGNAGWPGCAVGDPQNWGQSPIRGCCGDKFVWRDAELGSDPKSATVFSQATGVEFMHGAAVCLLRKLIRAFILNFAKVQEAAGNQADQPLN